MGQVRASGAKPLCGLAEDWGPEVVVVVIAMGVECGSHKGLGR